MLDMQLESDVTRLEKKKKNCCEKLQAPLLSKHSWLSVSLKQRERKRVRRGRDKERDTDREKSKKE